jgi:transcriptional regulator with XRE-family HTH domain
MATTKSANPIDVHVGNRVRLRRILLNISQEKLAEQLDLTFQQVQKYEKGSNRISASRLYRIAKILQVPVQFFFDNMSTSDREFVFSGSEYALREDGEEFVMDCVNSVEGVLLNQAFQRIQSAETRKSIVNLVKSLADAEANSI